MKSFRQDVRRWSPAQVRLYALYEVAFTTIQFAAGLLFLFGSWMLFHDGWQTLANWCFLIGSACFVIGPALKFVRELHFAVNGDLTDLAKRASQ